MGILIDGVEDGVWIITPDADKEAVEVALEVRGRRFVALFDDDELPTFEKLLADMRGKLDEPGRTSPLDVSQEAIRVFGRDPFVEAEIDRRPWYKKVLSELVRW